MRASTSGFTLAELAIVIVIVGLITGGILGGQALIAIAEARSVITDVERYRTSVGLFEQQYFALPGDMQNATDFWAGSTDSNGDGLLVFGGTPNESLLAWEHLSLAELEPSSFVSTGTDAQPGVNIPVARVGGGYSMYDGSGANGVKTALGLTTTKNFILLGKYDSSGLNLEPVLSPDDAYTIDDKMDDGRPESGQVFGRVGPSGSDCTETVATIEEYRVQNDQLACIMEFRFP